MKFTVTRQADTAFDGGLRGFFEYRDLGIAEATLHIVTMVLRLEQVVTQTVDKYNRGVHEGLLGLVVGCKASNLTPPSWTLQSHFLASPACNPI